MDLTNVILFPAQAARRTHAVRGIEGATLFMHSRRLTLIAHLARPRKPRALPAFPEKNSKA